MANGKSFQGVPLREVAVVAHAVSAALAGNRVTSDLDSALQTLLPGCLSVRIAVSLDASTLAQSAALRGGSQVSWSLISSSGTAGKALEDDCCVLEVRNAGAPGVADSCLTLPVTPPVPLGASASAACLLLQLPAEGAASLPRLLAPLSHLAHALAFCVPPQAAALAATMRAMLHPSAPAASSSGGNGATSASMSQPRGRRSRHSRRRAGGSGGGGGGMDDVDLLDDRGWMDLAAATGDPRDVGTTQAPLRIRRKSSGILRPQTSVKMPAIDEADSADEALELLAQLSNYHSDSDGDCGVAGFPDLEHSQDEDCTDQHCAAKHHPDMTPSVSAAFPGFLSTYSEEGGYQADKETACGRIFKGDISPRPEDGLTSCRGLVSPSSSMCFTEALAPTEATGPSPGALSLLGMSPVCSSEPPTSGRFSRQHSGTSEVSSLMVRQASAGTGGLSSLKPPMTPTTPTATRPWSVPGLPATPDLQHPPLRCTISSDSVEVFPGVNSPFSEPGGETQVGVARGATHPLRQHATLEWALTAGAAPPTANPRDDTAAGGDNTGSTVTEARDLRSGAFVVEEPAAKLKSPAKGPAGEQVTTGFPPYHPVPVRALSDPASTTQSASSPSVSGSFRGRRSPFEDLSQPAEATSQWDTWASCQTNLKGSFTRSNSFACGNSCSSEWWQDGPGEAAGEGPDVNSGDQLQRGWLLTFREPALERRFMRWDAVRCLPVDVLLIALLTVNITHKALTGAAAPARSTPFTHVALAIGFLSMLACALFRTNWWLQRREALAVFTWLAASNALRQMSLETALGLAEGVRGAAATAAPPLVWAPKALLLHCYAANAVVLPIRFAWMAPLAVWTIMVGAARVPAVCKASGYCPPTGVMPEPVCWLLALCLQCLCGVILPTLWRHHSEARARRQFLHTLEVPGSATALGTSWSDDSVTSKTSPGAPTSRSPGAGALVQTSSIQSS